MIMHQTRKDIIRFALDYDILNVSTYHGYRGDLLVKITVMGNDLDTVLAIKEKAMEMEMEVVIKDNKELKIFEVYCIVADEEVYDLKLGQ